MPAIEAIYENGVFRPLTPVESLRDGDRVVVTPAEATPAERLAAIAALPVEPGPEFAGRDHDQILYGNSEP
jgi:predicted DNA-binding antitoxin AbrB/MazE fold protein